MCEGLALGLAPFSLTRSPPMLFTYGPYLLALLLPALWAVFVIWRGLL